MSGTVEVLQIPRSDSLDIITVYFHDMAPGKGRIIIHCWGEAWATFWEAMGDRTVREFVSQADVGYLCGKLGGQRAQPKWRQHYMEQIVAAVSAHLRRLP